MYCSLCKSSQHLARSCPFSWHEIPAPSSQHDAADESALFRDDPGDGNLDQNDQLDDDASKNDLAHDDPVFSAASPAYDDPVSSAASPAHDDPGSPVSSVSSAASPAIIPRVSLSTSLFARTIIFPLYFG